MDEIELRMGVRGFFGVVGRVLVNESESDLPPDFIPAGEDAKDPGQSGNSGSTEVHGKPAGIWENLELYQRKPPKATGISLFRCHSAKRDWFIQVRLDNGKNLTTLSNETKGNKRLNVVACEKFLTYHRNSWKRTLFAM
jgi:hypothetical protein